MISLKIWALSAIRAIASAVVARTDARIRVLRRIRYAFYTERKRRLPWR